ncbi:hypothetical protein GCM10023116_23840 [Kistimonas scapharcae]|uniref:Esterase n=1 Tax=Kistimonas scapharcae TaxID=1036133 RepID=A0ABP8V2T0_9GAMM
MGWDKDYVRNKYGFHSLGQYGIFYPSENASRLLILFSSMGKDRYDRYSWFWNECERWDDTAYLFLKDDTFCYFLGSDERPLEQTFRKIILNHMESCGVNNKQVFTVGASMGGYAALYYASLMDFNGAIVSNPQIDYASARCHEFQNWERQIRTMGAQWYDLNDFLCKRKAPKVYIEYGNYLADKCAAEKLISTLDKKNSLYIVRKTDWSGHTVDSLKKETITSAITFFEQNDFYF